MAENIPTQNAEEIDLGYLFERIKSLFKSILIGIVSIIQFFWKHKFRLIGVGVLGIAIGLYLAKTAERIYVNELLIKPNYNSTQYVYDKIDALNFKIESKDSVFLKNIFDENYKKLKGVEINPVVDIYNLIGQSEDIEETFKILFTEIGDVSFFESDINKLAYANHKVKVLVAGEELNKEITNAFFSYIKINDFYEKQKDILIDKYSKKLVENEKMRIQIDTIIQSVKEQSLTNQFKQGISFSGSQNVTELIKKKEDLLENDFEIATSLVTENQIISLIAVNTALLDNSYNFAYRIIPVYFVLFYCLVFLVRHIVRKLSEYV